MGCAFNIKIVHPEEPESILKPLDPDHEESSVDSVETFVIDSPNFEYKKEMD